MVPGYIALNFACRYSEYFRCEGGIILLDSVNKPLLIVCGLNLVVPLLNKIYAGACVEQSAMNLFLGQIFVKQFFASSYPDL